VATVLANQQVNLREGLMNAFPEIFTHFAIDWATPLVCLLLAFSGIGGVISVMYMRQLPRSAQSAGSTLQPVDRCCDLALAIQLRTHVG
jgi:hypothetical protein